MWALGRRHHEFYSVSGHRVDRAKYIASVWVGVRVWLPREARSACICEYVSARACHLVRRPPPQPARRLTLTSRIQGTQVKRSNVCCKKRHINIYFFDPVALGVPGTSRVCPWDKPSLSQGQNKVFSLFDTKEAQFVPGIMPVTNGGRKVRVLNVYVPFSLASNVCCRRRQLGPEYGVGIWPD